MSQNLLYKNVTVSGLPGAGSTTLGKSLADKLGWELYCGGDFMRKYAVEKGLFNGNSKAHHDATIYNDDFDREVDFQARKTLQTEKNKVLDAWLSGFMAQGFKDTLKVLVYCQDDAIRVDRVVNRDELTVEEAKKHIFEREQKNLAKWQRMYTKEWQEWIIPNHPELKNKSINFWIPEIYDLSIDTFKLNPDQTLATVLQKLGYKA